MQSKIELMDVIAFFAAIVYMQSVLTVAHHTGMWVHNGSTHIVESPFVPALVVGLLLSGYSWFKKHNASTLVVITLTILGTASLFWLSGLRTNFYF